MVDLVLICTILCPSDKLCRYLEAASLTKLNNSCEEFPNSLETYRKCFSPDTLTAEKQWRHFYIFKCSGFSTDFPQPGKSSTGNHVKEFCNVSHTTFVQVLQLNATLFSKEMILPFYNYNLSLCFERTCFS